LGRVKGFRITLWENGGLDSNTDKLWNYQEAFSTQRQRIYVYKVYYLLHSLPLAAKSWGGKREMDQVIP
jgi:hypothetical protein